MNHTDETRVGVDTAGKSSHRKMKLMIRCKLGIWNCWPQKKKTLQLSWRCSFDINHCCVFPTGTCILRNSFRLKVNVPEHAVCTNLSPIVCTFSLGDNICFQALKTASLHHLEGLFGQTEKLNFYSLFESFKKVIFTMSLVTYLCWCCTQTCCSLM